MLHIIIAITVLRITDSSQQACELLYKLGTKGFLASLFTRAAVQFVTKREREVGERIQVWRWGAYPPWPVFQRNFFKTYISIASTEI